MIAAGGFMKNMYVRLALMAVVSFIAMFLLMYMMVDKLENVFFNVNQFYMAAIMTAPMVLIEIVLMSEMYRSKRANLAIAVGAVLILVVFSLFIRKQTAVSDTEFLKSMIPHHGGAVLMCNEAPLEDPEIKKLCEGIIS